MKCAYSNNIKLYYENLCTYFRLLSLVRKKYQMLKFIM